jgi:hypothetical protein
VGAGVSHEAATGDGFAQAQVAGHDAVIQVLSIGSTRLDDRIPAGDNRGHVAAVSLAAADRRARVVAHDFDQLNWRPSYSKIGGADMAAREWYTIPLFVVLVAMVLALVFVFGLILATL